jgi:2'-5' RNA ligase
MPYGVELYLDQDAESAIRQTWEAIAAAGLDSYMLDSNVRPHVSLAISDHIDQHDLIKTTADFAASLQPIRLTLASIGSFPTAEGVLFYGVTVNHVLLEVHAEYSRIFNHYARQPYAYYRVGTWVPHCTLAIGLSPEQMASAQEIARRTPLPIYSTTYEMGLVHATAGATESLAVFRLGKPA